MSAAKLWAAGDNLPVLTKEMSIDKMKTEIWSAGNPVHFDPEFAKSAGLPGPIATGEMSTSMMSELLARTFGPAWVRHSKLKSRYVAPVYAGDTLTIRGQIAGRVADGNQTRLDVDIWCENQNGQKVTVGEASLWL